MPLNFDPIIQAWESAFPGLIQCWYLLGSRADGTAVPLSDLDLFFVLKSEANSPEDAAKANRVSELLRSRYPFKIDAWGETLDFLTKLSEQSPAPRALIHTVSIKHGSKLLRGGDVRDKIPDPPMENYVEALVSIAEGWAAERRKRAKPEDPYHGLVGEDTKALVQSVLSRAAAMAASSGKIFLPTKSQILPAYRRFGDPRWLPLVQEAHETLWQKWGYRVENASLLRELCEEAVAFENETPWVPAESV